MITLDEARRVASLARLGLTDAELAHLAPQLDAIVAYVAHLSEASTEGVEPLAHPLDAFGVFRDDEPASSLPTDEALRASPGRDGPYHSVPAVLE